jgi:hypothetical protein
MLNVVMLSMFILCAVMRKTITLSNFMEGFIILGIFVLNVVWLC